MTSILATKLDMAEVSVSCMSYRRFSRMRCDQDSLGIASGRAV